MTSHVARWALPPAGAVVLVLCIVATSGRSDAPREVAAQPVPTVALLLDDFEAPAWPDDALWSIPVDPEDPRTLQYQWAPRDCRAVDGTRSLWGVGGGTLGSQLACGDAYPANVRSVAVLHLDLREHDGASVLTLAFDLWGDTLSDSALGDYFTINYLLPGTDGFRDRIPVLDWTGATGPAFRTERLNLLDLVDVFNPNRRFNVAGQRVDFEFVFRTARDSSFRPVGVFVDRLRLERDGTPGATPSPPATTAVPTTPTSAAITDTPTPAPSVTDAAPTTPAGTPAPAGATLYLPSAANGT